MSNKLGRVVEVVGKKAVIDIGTDDNPVLTPPLKWCVPAAGSINYQRVPSIGEQVLLVCVGDPNDLGALVIAGYLHCDAFPAPNTTADQLTIHAGKYQSTAKTDGNYNVSADVITTTSKSNTTQADKITLKGAITATMTMVIGKALSVAGIDFKGHTHMEQGDGKPTGDAQ